jgi:hypothetical protein
MDCQRGLDKWLFLQKHKKWRAGSLDIVLQLTDRAEIAKSVKQTAGFRG